MTKELQPDPPLPASAMKVVSVNVGLPRELQWRGMTVETGIFKSPVEGAVAIKKLNLAGDRQADLTVHGGPDKAVYGYPDEHYEYWRSVLPEASLPRGVFGENLTTIGLLEENLHIGDQLKVGSAVLVVVQPRLPCYKLALRFDRDDMIKRFVVARRSGFYFSVRQEGEVAAGAPIEILSRDPEQVSVLDIFNLFFGNTRDPDLLARALRVEALPESWKADLPRRVGLPRPRIWA